jgi:Double zinc ribbon
MPLALFGITDGSINLAVNLLILVLVVVWLALVYWTWADARRRIADPVLIGTATAASLIPFIGTIVYTILRPPEFLADAREREVETQASELRMRHLIAQSCPRCEHPIERSWLRCPECQHRLKDPCVSCNRPVDPRWAVCPYCETPLRAEEPAPARKRSSRSSSRSSDASAAAPKRATRRKAAPSSPSPSSSSTSEAAARTQRGERPKRAERPPASEPGDEGEPGSRRRSATSS